MTSDHGRIVLAGGRVSWVPFRSGKASIFEVQSAEGVGHQRTTMDQQKIPDAAHFWKYYSYIRLDCHKIFRYMARPQRVLLIQVSYCM